MVPIRKLVVDYKLFQSSGYREVTSQETRAVSYIDILLGRRE